MCVHIIYIRLFCRKRRPTEAAEGRGCPWVPAGVQVDMEPLTSQHYLGGHPRLHQGGHTRTLWHQDTTDDDTQDRDNHNYNSHTGNLTTAICKLV